MDLLALLLSPPLLRFIRCASIPTSCDGVLLQPLAGRTIYRIRDGIVSAQFGVTMDLIWTEQQRLAR
jgi:hypothetical protein